MDSGSEYITRETLELSQMGNDHCLPSLSSLRHKGGGVLLKRHCFEGHPKNGETSFYGTGGGHNFIPKTYGICSKFFQYSLRIVSLIKWLNYKRFKPIKTRANRIQTNKKFVREKSCFTFSINLLTDSRKST